MLVLTLDNTSPTVVITHRGEKMTLSLQKVKGRKAMVGIEAPMSFVVLREDAKLKEPMDKEGAA